MNWPCDRPTTQSRSVKLLRTIWQSNRGNIRELVKPEKSVKDSVVQSVLSEHLDDNNCEHSDYSSSVDNNCKHLNDNNSVENNSIISESSLKCIINEEATFDSFQADTPEHTTFFLSDEEWARMQYNRHERYFKGYSWEGVIVEKLKISNPYYVIMFRNHSFSIAKTRKRHTPFLTINGYCAHNSCEMKVKITMTEVQALECNVLYKGKILHAADKLLARPFRAQERATLAESLQQSAYNLYNNLLGTAYPKSLAAQNRSAIGTNPSVLRKIKWEQSFIDRNEVVSLQMLKEKLYQNDLNNRHIKGFIQLIQVSPLKVICFTEGGIRLWHDMVKTTCAYWDATGGFVDSKLTQKRILFYEIVLSTPSAPFLSTPIACMITEQHTQNSLEHFLRTVREYEMKVFGTNSQPIQINSDRSVVLLNSSLKVLNSESMQNYLQRCWRIVNGLANDNDFKLTTLRTCKSHLMKQASELCKKQYSIKDSRYMVGMYMFSLLVNSKNIQEICSIVYDVCIVLGSVSISKAVEESINKIKYSVLKLNTNVTPAVADDDSVAEDSDVVLEHKNSPFFKRFNDIRIQAELCYGTEQDNGKNMYYGPMLLDKLFKNFLPVIPLWSDLMSGNMCRFSTKYPNKTLYTNKSTSISEATFKNTKQLFFNSQKHRIDTCIDDLYVLYKAREREFCEKLKLQINRHKHKTVLSEVEEMWQKKMLIPRHLKRTFQSAPQSQTKIFSLNKSNDKGKCSQGLFGNESSKKICKFPNVFQNCWFNATVQSFLHHNIVQATFRSLDPESVHP
ncbi:hypothetical protein ACEWY4_023607 [Coilia grayii]|uniref:Uncharacterized protein n=1 Tax=Coilia grayii TaxID=363190 RepID=A0ABD1J3I9_9TELE